ncbi:unnamed protein product [Arabidopsis thaliana]|uniref:Uncharacterized protein n=1 Tax=Arabidopsis thaliana TaxID=3702 RepID=A0A654FHN5_ARATH|nr:unnamed protein product [Arabidopsis thaliana]
MSLETKNTKRDLLYGIDAATRTTIPIKDLANAKPIKTQEKDLSEEHPLNKMGRDKGEHLLNNLGRDNDEGGLSLRVGGMMEKETEEARCLDAGDEAKEATKGN